MRALWAFILNVVATLIYAVGLLSPLTPSEGRPSDGELFFFAIIPVGLFSFSGVLIRNWLIRVIVAIELIGVIGFTGWLLNLQWKQLTNLGRHIGLMNLPS